MTAMEFKAKTIGSLLLFLILILLHFVAPALSRGRLHVKNMDLEVYNIDYRGPETHTYIPPPSRAGDRPRIHHQTSMARQKSKLHKGKKIVG